MPMVFEWIITEPTGRKTAVIAQTRSAAIEVFAAETGMLKDIIADDCKIERGGRI